MILWFPGHRPNALSDQPRIPGGNKPTNTNLSISTPLSGNNNSCPAINSNWFRKQLDIYYDGEFNSEAQCLWWFQEPRQRGKSRSVSIAHIERYNRTLKISASAERTLIVGPIYNSPRALKIQWWSSSARETSVHNNGTTKSHGHSFWPCAWQSPWTRVVTPYLL